MKTNRQLHLWIGLICSAFILIEAITGLLLTEPWLMGVETPSVGRRLQADPGANFQIPDTGYDSAKGGMGRRFQAGEGFPGGAEDGFRRGGFGGQFMGGQNSVMGIVRGLHAGRIGTTDISLLVDLTAIALIILTITGIVLTVRELRDQRKNQNSENGNLPQRSV